MVTLFDKFNVGNLVLKNRFARSATAERCADEKGFFSKDVYEMYGALARGGTGLIITGYAAVHISGRCGITQPLISDDKFIPQWEKLAGAVHSQGEDCRVLVQLVHGGRQVQADAAPSPVAPSAVKDNLTGVIPKEMTEREILRTIENFADAAMRAKLAGFDGVQIHAAHGYLISAFMSPRSNVRTDQWGDSLENRARFLIEIFRAVRERTGDDFIAGVKLNGDDGMDGGMDILDACYMAKCLAREGVDFIEVSGGTWETPSIKGTCRMNIRTTKKEAYFLDNAKRIKTTVGPSVPVIAVGGFRSLQAMEEAFYAGMSMVSLCRPLIREPDLINKFKLAMKNKADCISCNGCLGVKDGMTRCVKLI
ncbi:MAG: NADH:flavin oxidoreductase [Planctomycetes bacterium]|nr:NADH:flavin oxidoreductase [Planctomycetota bacterium]